MGIFKKYPALFLGLTITIIFLGLGLFGLNFFDTLELKLYDVMMNLRSEPQSPSSIVIVDIDNDSIEKLGRWPWPRALLAKGVNKINEGSPRVVGLNIMLSEPEESAGLKELVTLEELFSKDVLDPDSDKDTMFLRTLRNALVKIDNDKKLEAALKTSGNVVLPVFFKVSPAVEEAIPTDQALIDQSIQNVNNPGGFEIPKANEIILPIPAYFNASIGIGHINLAYDLDGTARRERLLYDYKGLYIPSYTLRLATAKTGNPLSEPAQ